MAAPNVTPLVGVLLKFYAAEAKFMATPADSPDAKANFDEMASNLAPDIKVYQPEDLPWGGTWEGVEGLLGWAKMMTSYFDKLEPEPLRIFDDGKDTVVIESIVHVRIKKTGVERDIRLAQLATVDGEKGVIKDIRQYPFEVQATLALLKE